MRNTIFILLMIILFSVGCSDNDDKLNVQIRVQNSTENKLDKVSIDSLVYNDIDAGAKTAYQVKDNFIPPRQLIVVADSLMINEVIDNIQQDTLQPGRYTYKINTFSDADGLQYEVIVD